MNGSNHKGLPSISKSALMLSPCITWAEQGAEWYDETKVDNTKRDQGNEFHTHIDCHLKNVKCGAPKDSEVAKWLKRAVKYIETKLGVRVEKFWSEVAVQVNWATGHCIFLGHIVDRHYPHKPGYQNGTADLVCLLKTGELLIADWKTGATDGAEEQLLSLACVIQNIELFKYSDGVRPVRIACLVVNADGVWPHEREVSDQELANHWEAMTFRTEDIQHGKPRAPVPGLHCTTLYCPHLCYCSVIGAESQRFAEAAPKEGPQGPAFKKGGKMHLKVTDKPTSAEEAGYTMAMVAAVNRRMKYLTESIKSYLAKGGKATQGEYEWSDGNNGFRWRKQTERN